MDIETLEIFGFYTAFRALRLPHKGQHKSDTEIHNITCPDVNNGKLLIGNYNMTIGDKDLQLLSSLVVNGDEHAKVNRAIIVSVELNAPRYWWQEMDTYRIGHERASSESTMHSEAKNLTGKELQKFKAEIKEGLMQKRIDTFSYQTLRRIRLQRRPHRLPEWQEFCDWIETLPLSNYLITRIK